MRPKHAHEPLGAEVSQSVQTWKCVLCVRGISPRYDLPTRSLGRFGKTWPLRMQMPLDCKYSNKGTFPLRSYQMEKSTCLFWFALHLLHAVFFFFFFFHKRTETYYFVGQKTDYMGVIGSVFCSCSQRRASRCLLLNAYLPFLPQSNIRDMSVRGLVMKCRKYLKLHQWCSLSSASDNLLKRYWFSPSYPQFDRFTAPEDFLKTTVPSSG